MTSTENDNIFSQYNSIHSELTTITVKEHNNYGLLDDRFYNPAYINYALL